jgi:outer membrane protein assembly factor BamB
MKRCHALLALGLVALGSTIAAAGDSAAPAGDWPQWLGPNRDGISTEQGLLKEWPKEGPAIIWHVDTVGVGYSSISVKNGKIFTQGDIDGVEHILALDTKDGRVLWAVQPAPVIQLLDTRIANELKQIDKSGDGKIDELEALARFGWEWNKYDKPAAGASEKGAPEAIAQRRAAFLFEQLDKDQNAQLSFAEAGNLLREAFDRIDSADPKADNAALAAARTAEYLKQLDKDADGQISKQEAKGTALDRHFGRIDIRDPATNKADELLTAAEIAADLEKHEAGRDGIIAREELERYYVQNKVIGDGMLSAAELRAAFGGYRNGMGDGPRGTPTVDGDVLYAEGGNGDVTCLDAASGKTIWSVNLRADFGGGLPGWGYSESPLVVGDKLIVTPGGKAGTLVALDKHNGQLIWQSKEVTEGAHYSSPVLAEVGGIKQIVQFANQSVFGVSLADGKPLWRYTAPANGTANCCTPIVADDFVFASSAYGTGGGLAKIVTSGSVQSAEQVYFEKKMACHHGGIVKLGDFLYSAGGGPLMCMNFKTGEIAWQARSAGKGSLCIADGMLYVLGEGQEAALAEATPEGYREHSRFKYEGHGKPSWAYPVVAGGRLYIRDQQSLTAYDVKAK